MEKEIGTLLLMIMPFYLIGAAIVACNLFDEPMGVLKIMGIILCVPIYAIAILITIMLLIIKLIFPNSIIV